MEHLEIWSNPKSWNFQKSDVNRYLSIDLWYLEAPETTGTCLKTRFCDSWCCFPYNKIFRLAVNPIWCPFKYISTGFDKSQLHPLYHQLCFGAPTLCTSVATVASAAADMMSREESATDIWHRHLNHNISCFSGHCVESLTTPGRQNRWRTSLHCVVGYHYSSRTIHYTNSGFWRVVDMFICNICTTTHYTRSTSRNLRRRNPLGIFSNPLCWNPLVRYQVRFGHRITMYTDLNTARSHFNNAPSNAHLNWEKILREDTATSWITQKPFLNILWVAFDPLN